MEVWTPKPEELTTKLSDVELSEDLTDKWISEEELDLNGYRQYAGETTSRVVVNVDLRPGNRTLLSLVGTSNELSQVVNATSRVSISYFKVFTLRTLDTYKMFKGFYRSCC
jgi:hypothetical protein